MDDAAFRNELWIYSYKAQIDGYYFGWPQRKNFHPIVVMEGTREATLELPVYSGLTPFQKALMLNTNPDAKAGLEEVRKEHPEFDE